MKSKKSHKINKKIVGKLMAMSTDELKDLATYVPYNKNGKTNSRINFILIVEALLIIVVEAFLLIIPLLGLMTIISLNIIDIVIEISLIILSPLFVAFLSRKICMKILNRKLKRMGADPEMADAIKFIIVNFDEFDLSIDDFSKEMKNLLQNHNNSSSKILESLQDKLNEYLALKERGYCSYEDDFPEILKIFMPLLIIYFNNAVKSKLSTKSIEEIINRYDMISQFERFLMDRKAMVEQQEKERTEEESNELSKILDEIDSARDEVNKNETEKMKILNSNSDFNKLKDLSNRVKSSRINMESKLIQE